MPFPKVGKKLQTKRQLDLRLDKAESELVRERAEGRCEVYEQSACFCGCGVRNAFRCQRRAVQVMHLIGGRGKRGRGISALKEHKLHGCLVHHREIDGDIGGKKLKRIGGPIPLWTDVYERIVAKREREL